jgi:hypothetical protein
MQPYLWGKFVWTSIHFISLGYPNEPSAQDKIDYKNYFENLYAVLPCYACSQNYQDHLRELPITDKVLSDTKSLFKWTVQLHNIVNTSLHKKQMSYEEAYQLYTSVYPKRNGMMEQCFSNLLFRDSPKNTDTSVRTWLWITNTLLCVAFILFFMRKSFQKPS